MHYCEATGSQRCIYSGVLHNVSLVRSKVELHCSKTLLAFHSCWYKPISIKNHIYLLYNTQNEHTTLLFKPKCEVSGILPISSKLHTHKCLFYNALNTKDKKNQSWKVNNLLLFPTHTHHKLNSLLGKCNTKIGFANVRHQKRETESEDEKKEKRRLKRKL